MKQVRMQEVLHLEGTNEGGTEKEYKEKKYNTPTYSDERKEIRS